MTQTAFAAQIGERDLLYVYKEQYFTGFAPCFDRDLYSLACCKGRRNGGGMRESICRKAAGGAVVWILSIAAQAISGLGEHPLPIAYQPGDMICLARVDAGRLYSWREYGAQYPWRRDAIYAGAPDQKGLVYRGNAFDEHDPPEQFMPTDCASDCTNYADIKQIIVSKDYALFGAGHQVDARLNVRRGFACQGRDIGILKRYLFEHEGCLSLIGKNPWQHHAAGKSGCSPA